MTGRARSDRDYYEVLGVHPEATEDELRRAAASIAAAARELGLIADRSLKAAA